MLLSLSACIRPFIFVHSSKNKQLQKSHSFTINKKNCLFILPHAHLNLILFSVIKKPPITPIPLLLLSPCVRLLNKKDHLGGKLGHWWHPLDIPIKNHHMLMPQGMILLIYFRNYLCIFFGVLASWAPLLKVKKKCLSLSLTAIFPLWQR